MTHRPSWRTPASNHYQSCSMPRSRWSISRNALPAAITIAASELSVCCRAGRHDGAAWRVPSFWHSNERHDSWYHIYFVSSIRAVLMSASHRHWHRRREPRITTAEAPIVVMRIGRLLPLIIYSIHAAYGHDFDEEHCFTHRTDHHLFNEAGVPRLNCQKSSCLSWRLLFDVAIIGYWPLSCLRLICHEEDYQSCLRVNMPEDLS